MNGITWGIIKMNGKNADEDVLEWSRTKQWDSLKKEGKQLFLLFYKAHFYKFSNLKHPNTAR